MPPKSATGFWSIERAVAFVAGPLITAGAGALSAFLVKKVGVHVAPAEITGAFVTGAGAAAGLIYKWLHGRQIEMKLPFGFGELLTVPGEYRTGLGQDPAPSGGTEDPGE